MFYNAANINNIVANNNIANDDEIYFDQLTNIPNPDHTNGRLNPALYKACKLRNWDKVRTLATRRIGIDFLDYDGDSALSWAASNNAPDDIIDALIIAGLNINGQCRTRGQTPMHWALCYASMDSAQRLLSHGCDLSVVNKHGDSPLHLAAPLRNVQLVVSMVKHGANIQMKNAASQTPLDLLLDESVQDKESQHIVAFLSSLPTFIHFLAGGNKFIVSTSTTTTQLPPVSKLFLNEPGLLRHIWKFLANIPKDNNSENR
jgi:ankyrin repeat protein